MTVAELSSSDVMGARFREGIRRAGGLVVGDSAVDQETLRQAGAAVKRDDRPDYIEIDTAEGLREIVIVERDGTRHALHPSLSYGNAKKLAFYQRQLARLQTELDACEDEDQYMAIVDRASAAEERLIQLVIPDFPAGLLDRLDASTVAQLRDAGSRMQSRQGDDPNAASRDGQS